MGTLFRKTLSRYLSREALPNIDPKPVDSRLRDRSFSFCQVPSASELSSCEFSGGRRACDASVVVKGRSESESSNTIGARETSNVLGAQGTPQISRPEKEPLHQHVGVVGGRLPGVDDWRGQVAAADIGESLAGNTDGDALRDHLRMSKNAFEKDAVSGSKASTKTSRDAAGAADLYEDCGAGEDRSHECSKDASPQHRQDERCVRYLEFAMHSAVNGHLNGSTVGGGEQLQLEHVFGSDLPEVLSYGIFVAGLGRPETGRVASRDEWLCDVMMKQSGVLRINCIDCLDRTNVAMSLLARWTFVRQLEYTGVLTEGEARTMYSGDAACFPNTQDAVVGLWASHGDALSLQYAGSQALQSDVTRTGRRTLQGLLSDSVSSVQRYVQRSLYDSSTQEMLDWLLGQAEPALLHPAHSQVDVRPNASFPLRNQADGAGCQSAAARGDSRVDEIQGHRHNAERSRPSVPGQIVQNENESAAQSFAKGARELSEKAIETGVRASAGQRASSPKRDMQKLGNGANDSSDALVASPAHAAATMPGPGGDSPALPHAIQSDGKSLGVVREEIPPKMCSGKSWFGLAAGWRRRGREQGKQHEEGGCAREGAGVSADDLLATTCVRGDGGDEGGESEEEWEIVVKM